MQRADPSTGPSRSRSPPRKRHRPASSSLSASTSVTPPSITSPQPPAKAPVVATSIPVTPLVSNPSSTKWFRKPSVVWYRGNDLRVEDHPALLAAAQRGGPVVPFFVWDPTDGFGANLGPVKQWWLRESLTQLQRDLRRLGVHLYTRTGRSTDELRNFLLETGADAVFWNRCYEPDLLTRDEELRKELALEGLTAESFKAELLVEPWELSNSEISPPFATFHSYMCVWMTVPPPPQPFPCPSRLLPLTSTIKSTEIHNLGFQVESHINQVLSKLWSPGSAQAKVQLDKFLNEVFPAFGEETSRRHFEGTSRLSPHIRFGELSPRRMYHATRLRVSRWDQFATLDTAFSAAAPKKHNTPSKQPADISTESKKPPPSSPPTSTTPQAAKEISEKQTQPSSNSANNGVQSNSDSLRSLAEDRKNSNTTPLKSPNCTANEQAKRSILYRKRALPHISLSARAFLKNLCLRDFSYHVLFHNPDFNIKPLVPEFASFPWAQDDGGFDSWKNATTGYPIVDAAMRELKETGWIHNAMRILLACFLTKYLLLPWPRGLKEFYNLLLDGDHSSNALGWQWTAGSNTDAFPFSCLINPVKVAHRHDPKGNYVRRWLPELANLSTEYIHQPWKAPPEVLLAAGVEIGKTYPKRVVLVSEARTRAREAMAVMRQILSGSTILRGVIDTKDDVLLKEWPEEDVEVPPMEDTVPFNGKMGLLPSLWSLLQCDQPSSCLTGPAAGTDHLIAMETACLTEGALAMPLEDQHESIEHALITAHEHGPSSAAMSVVGLGASIPPVQDNDRGKEQAPNHRIDTDPCAVASGVESGMEDDEIDEMKFSEPDVSPFEEREKPVKPIPTTTPLEAREQSDPSGVPHRSSQSFHSIPLNGHTSGFATMTSHSMNPSAAMPYHHAPQQQLQHLQQLQQQHQFHQLQQFHLQQQKQQHAHNIMDGMYMAGNPPGNLPNNNVAGVPMTSPPVMMGPATSPTDLASNPVFPTADPSSAMYPHQMNIAPFYGFPPVMPMMNTHGLSNADRGDVPGSAGAANAHKLAMSGMLPVGYGMYGSSMFDPNVLGSTFASSGAQYGALPTTQQQSHATPPNPYGLPGQPVYFSSPANHDVLHRQGAAHPRQSSVYSPGSNQHLSSALQGQTNSVNAAVAAAAVVAGGIEVANNVVSEPQTGATQHGQHATDSVLPSATQRVPHVQTIPPSSADSGKVSRGNSAANTTRPSQNRGIGKTGSRTTSRSRRGTGGSAPGSKSKGEGGAQSHHKNRNTETGTGSSQKGNRAAAPQAGITLKDRREILSSVLGKEDHKYHGFARYLSATYELTDNTDRHVSKDYVRLCNLKDDYHKQCKSDEDKLKIYTIKSFFSTILKLEVTGEWDRHNHGGVRGPYVYGIRVRKAVDGKEAASA